MANMLICAPNYVDFTTVTPRFGGGNWSQALSPENLNSEFFTEVTRSTNDTASSTILDIDLGASRSVGFVGIPDSNISITGTIKFEGSDTPAWTGVTVDGAHSASDTTLDVTSGSAVTITNGDTFTIAGDSVTYQVTSGGGTGTSLTLTIKRVSSATAGLAGALSGSEVITCHTGDFTGDEELFDSGSREYFPFVYPLDGGGLPWGDVRIWTGKFTDEDLQRLNFPRQHLYILPEAKFCRYIRISVTDESNADGYVEIDGLYITGVYEPNYNMSYGVDFGRKSNTTKESARGGADVFEKRRSQRYVDFSLDFLSDSEAFTALFDIDAEVDVDGNMYFVYDKADVEYLIRRSFPCRFENLSSSAAVFYQNNTKSFSLIERIA